MRTPFALCLGGAGSVWEDLAAAERLTAGLPTLVVACNFAGVQYAGRLDAWATLHHEMLPTWRRARAAAGFNTDYRVFVHEASRRAPDGEVLAQGWYGSSGLYMAQVALEAMGCSGAILCGVPMDEEAGHIHWPGNWTHKHTARYRAGVEAAKADGAPIRSMSGWTSSILGKPDAAWITSLKGQPCELR